MAPRDMTPLSTEELQRLEENAEAREGVEDVLDTGSDAGSDDGDSGANPPEPAKPRREEPAVSPGDAKRNAIIDRFTRPDTRVFNGDMNDPSNLYGEVADEALQPDENGDPLVGAPPPAPSPKRMITLTIRGKPVEMSEDEVIARAQKVEAADSYLEESRELLQEAKTIKAERSGRATQHPEGDDRTREDGQDLDPSDRQTRHPGLDLKSVIEKIQFGDPDEAAAALAEAIQQTSTQAATQAANEGHVTRLIKNDLTKSQADLKAFRDANPELNSDENAALLIEQQVYKIYREEIEALGVVEKENIPTNPKDLADWHRYYRINGLNVSKTSDILNKAKDSYTAWRGDSPQGKQAAKPSKDAPRIAVNVDRTERRQAIPQQPTRAVAPRRDATPPPTIEQSRKSAFNEMRKARGQTTG